MPITVYFLGRELRKPTPSEVWQQMVRQRPFVGGGGCRAHFASFRRHPLRRELMEARVGRFIRDRWCYGGPPHTPAYVAQDGR